MNRRETVLALAALGAAPLTALAQQPGKVWRIGVLSPLGRDNALDPLFIGAFPLGMRELGYAEGKNLVLEWRFAEGDAGRLPVLAAELAALNLDVIVAVAHSAALAAQKATTTIPIVMTTSGDPVAGGLVRSMARPGGNITGLSVLSQEIGPKRLEMLRAFVPKLSSVAVLYNGTNQTNAEGHEKLLEAGARLGIKILPVEARTPAEIDAGFSQMRLQGAGALIVFLQPLFQQQKDQIAALALKQRLPSIGADQMYAQAGCLMSYGSSLAYTFHRVATYVDKILKGAKPADLPIEQPTKFDLVINRKTARALGLAVPQSLLLLADRVIE